MSGLDLARLVYAGQQYAQLLAVTFCAWGFGHWALGRLVPAEPQRGDRHALAVAVGLGVLILLLQALAIAGVLSAVPLGLVGLGGIALGLLEVGRCDWRGAVQRRRRAWGHLQLRTRLLCLAAAALAASLLLRPLAPPREWDELMYHLPHAAEWAAAGRLTVNEWLRYPWFPYNYDLLYAAALVTGNDVLPHLLHALAGWTTTWLLVGWAARRVGMDLALCAALLWLWLARDLFGNAYVDLGVTLFVFLAFVAADAWREGRKAGWLLLCGFALGVAAGSKYQVLAFVPFFLAVAWWTKAPRKSVAAAALAFLVPCAYWYGRNLLLAGDPFAPLGGRLFGFADWNLGDYEIQLADLRRHAGAPPLLLWPAAIGMAWQVRSKDAPARFWTAFALWALLVWAATSRYPRYLLPAYPVLALLAVLGYEQAWRWVVAALRLADAVRQRVHAGVAAAVLVVAGSVGLADLGRSWRDIATTAEGRDEVLARHVAGYRMWQYLRTHPRGRIYQVGAEGGLYYAPRGTRGDHFGPWRYRDYAGLDAAALRERLQREGFDALLVHRFRGAAVRATYQADFALHFALERRDGDVALFSIRKDGQP